MTLRVRYTEKFLRQSHCRDEETNKENRNAIFTTKKPPMHQEFKGTRRQAREFLHEGLDKGIFEEIRGGWLEVDTKGILLLELADLALGTVCMREEDLDKFAEIFPATTVDRLVEGLDIPAITQAWKEFDLYMVLQGEGLVDEGDTAPLFRFFKSIHEATRNYLEESKERIAR